jgi:hypothetical protein
MTNASSILPGSVVILEGDYSNIKIQNIQGTADKPITFINKGRVNVGGYQYYTMVLQGKYFKLLGNGDSSIKYGIRLNSAPGTYLVGLELENSTNVEVANCEFNHFSAGIKQNPTTGTTPMVDCYYHNNYFHDFDNPNAAGRAECFYLGNTSTTIPYNAPFRFINCRVENNVIENVSGDGIQMCNGTFVCKGNIIKNFALAQLIDQRNGIELGGNASGIITYNKIRGGKGDALQILGVGNIEVGNNSFTDIDVSNQTNQDIVYISARVNISQGAPLLNLNFHDNYIQGITPRYAVNHGTISTSIASSAFTNNRIQGTYLKPYNITVKDAWQ